MFQKREVLIVEDGSDLKGFRTKDYDPKIDDKKQIKVDLNKYIHKYDYELAEKLVTQKNNQYAFCKENQKQFNEKAFAELL